MSDRLCSFSTDELSALLFSLDPLTNSFRRWNSFGRN